MSFFPQRPILNGSSGRPATYSIFTFTICKIIILGIAIKFRIQVYQTIRIQTRQYLGLHNFLGLHRMQSLDSTHFRGIDCKEEENLTVFTARFLL